MKKEMLTIDIVKKEYKQQLHSSFKTILLSVGLFMALVVMFLFLFSGLGKQYTIVKLFFVSILLLVFSFCVLAMSDFYKASRALSR